MYDAGTAAHHSGPPIAALAATLAMALLSACGETGGHAIDLSPRPVEAVTVELPYQTYYTSRNVVKQIAHRRGWGHGWWHDYPDWCGGKVKEVDRCIILRYEGFQGRATVAVHVQVELFLRSGRTLALLTPSFRGLRDPTFDSLPPEWDPTGSTCRPVRDGTHVEHGKAGSASPQPAESRATIYEYGPGLGTSPFCAVAPNPHAWVRMRFTELAHYLRTCGAWERHMSPKCVPVRNTHEPPSRLLRSR